VRCGMSRRCVGPINVGPAEVSCAGESGQGREAGGEVVLDAAFAGELCAADPGFACRTARHIVVVVNTGFLVGHPASSKRWGV